jgi:SAM-dependent methyltransferase
LAEEPPCRQRFARLLHFARPAGKASSVFDTYAEIFAERAGDYHSAMQRFPRARDAEFRAVIEPLGDAASGLVCDMPSGGGYLAQHLPEGMDYLGIDPVEQFRSASQREGHRVINAPITAVPLPDGSADFVISLAGLHHEPDLAAVFAEFVRLVRPAGRIVIADAAKDTPTARFLNGFVAEHNPQGHDGHFLDEAAPPLLEAAGAAILEDRMIDMPWQFASIEQAGEFCGTLFGLGGVTRKAVAEGLETTIGFDRLGEDVRLNWALRRIVCTKA